jgi:hypothetical protein
MQISLLGARVVVVATDVVVVMVASWDAGEHADKARANPNIATSRYIQRPYPVPDFIIGRDRVTDASRA